MKKLKLNLDLTETLSRDQMKKVIGGYGDFECFKFNCGSTCPTAPGWCSCTSIAGGDLLCLGG